MSSRGSLVGSGPQSGIYQPRPTPPNPEDIPVYISDELLSLGGRINNVLEGGAFPPQSELPKRFREGMMIFFTNPVKNPLYKKSLFEKSSEPEYTITSSGVWLYKGKKWWKIIDDPSALVQTLTVYKTLPKGDSVPPKPPANKFLESDLEGWGYVPSPSSPTTDQWMSVAASAEVGEPVNVSWSEPIRFNAQGDAGQPGVDGYSIVFRYIASTKQPVIADSSVDEPITVDGVPFTLEIPSVSHPDNSFIWMIQGYFRNGGLKGPWSDAVKMSTPDTTISQEAYQVSKGAYTNFNPDASGLPSGDWVSTIPEIPNGYTLWKTTRLAWSDGTGQSNWSTPFMANGLAGSKNETRYIASTVIPTISDVKDRNPTSTTGEAFTLSVPPVTHPDKSFVWATSGIINRLGEMEVEWSSPVRYATPDVTLSVNKYAKSSGLTYPPFTPDADSPGPDWEDSPPDTTDQIWITTRLQWSGGSSITPWSIPVLFTGKDGAGFYTIVDNSITEWPLDAVERFKAHVGRAPILDDVLTFSNTLDKPVLTRRFDGVDWVEPSAIFNGDVIATGTISGDRITAGTSISAPSIKGGTISIGDNFNVNASGILTAKGANIAGTLNSVNMNSGSINIGSGKFVVNSAGAMTATQAVISGNSRFVGNVEATSGKFSGNITSTATIQGGTISGAHLQGGDIRIGGTSSNPNFYVDTNGNLTANNGHFGGTISVEGIPSGYVEVKPMTAGSINSFAPNRTVSGSDTYTIEPASYNRLLIPISVAEVVWAGKIRGIPHTKISNVTHTRLHFTYNSRLLSTFDWFASKIGFDNPIGLNGQGPVEGVHAWIPNWGNKVSVPTGMPVHFFSHEHIIPAGERAVIDTAWHHTNNTPSGATTVFGLRMVRVNFILVKTS